MYFIEKREDRFNNLSNLLAREYGGEIRNVVLDLPIHGSADMEIRKILGRIREKPGFNPVLIFLDQFGYSAVPMELICDTLSMPSSEILSFMNWRDLNRYITDETKWAGISRAFEGDEWKEVLPLEGLARSRRFLELYDQAIRQKARADFCCTFSMHDQGGQLLYWLIFCSNSDRGLEEMKKAMWSVDVTGRFQFSDKHMNQLSLLPSFTQQWLADALVKSLDGREMTIGEIRHYVLNETPCYQYNGALKLLEDEGRLSISRAPDGRRRGSFKKFEDSRELIVRFQKRERQTQLF
jgi:three-Cys-motif partner protein